MGLNMQGLGYSFFGQDKNLSKMAGAIEKDIINIDKAVDELNTSAGKNGLGGALDYITRMPDVRGFVSNMSAYAGDFKITTTQLEQHWIQADKAFQQASAGMNMSTKDAKKWQSTISQVSYDLVLDVGQVAESFKAVQQSGVDLAKIGLKDFKTFQKFVAVTGIDAKQFTASLTYLKNQVGFTDDQLKDYLETTASIGKQFNLGTEAMAAMSGTVQTLQEQNAKLFALWGPARTKRFLEGTALVAGAFLKAGKTADEAQVASQQLMATIVKGQGEFQDVFSGLSTTIGEFGGTLAENFRTAEGAFQILQNSPDQFISEMQRMYEAIKKNKTGAALQEATGRFTSQLTKVVGPAVTDLITRGLGPMGKQFGDVAAQLNGPGGLANKNGALVQMANHYRTALTPQEELGRAQDRFQTRLKKMAGLNDWQFLHKYNVSVKMAEERLSSLAHKAGPGGFIFKALVGLKNYGFGGMLSQIHPLGPAIADLTKSFAPVIQMMPGLVATFGMLASPITIVAGAIGLIYAYTKDIGGMRSIINDVFGKISDFLSNIGATAMKAFRSIDWDKVIAIALDAIHSIMKTAGKAWDGVVSFFQSVDWVKVGNYVGVVLIGLFELAVEGIKGVASKIPAIFEAVFDAAAAIVRGIWDKMGKYIDDQFGIFAEPIKIALTTIGVIAAAAFGYLAVSAVTAFITSAASAVMFWGAVLGPIALVIAGVAMVTKVFLKLSDTAKIAGMVIGAAMYLALGPIGAVIGAVVAIGAGIAMVIKHWDGIKQGFADSWHWVAGKVSGAWDKMKGAASSFFGWVTGSSKKAVQEVHYTAEELSRSADFIMSKLKKFVADHRQEVTRAVESTKSIVGSLYSSITFANGKSAKAAQAGLNKTTDAATDAIAEAAKAQGISTETATNFMQSLTYSDPKQLAKSIGMIKGAYLDFLNDALSKTKKITKDAQAAFQAFQNFSLKHWKDESAKITEFTKNSGLAIDTFWTLLLKKFEMNMMVLGVRMTGAFEKIRNMFGDYSLLDALAGPDKIFAWARNVAIALYEALSTKDPFSAAIQNYTNNAQKVIERMMQDVHTSEQANLATQGTIDGPESHAAETVKNEIVKAINDPYWTHEAMELWKRTADSMESLADAIARQGGQDKPKRAVARPSIAPITMPTNGVNG
jgi:hypothetical protein